MAIRAKHKAEESTIINDMMFGTDDGATDMAKFFKTVGA
jgi:hypothetical protein